jgi:RNA polymerase sigma-70 factor (ECF subfamily)
LALAIERAKRREPEALAAFFRQHEARLFAYFAGPLHWHAVHLPDLVQETVARAIQAFPSFRGSAEAQAERWLFGIARNVHMQEVSRQVGIRLRRDVASELASLQAPIGDFPRSNAVSWWRLDILAALDELPLAQLEALRLMLEGLTIREIAQRLDVPEGTVAVRIHRARQHLRQRLDLSC